MERKGHRIREFFETEAQALYRRFRVIETLLPSSHGRGSAHRAEEGRHIESILRDFLNRHLPADIRALSGFIVRPATKTGTANYERVIAEGDNHSTQLDIIVFDTARYPLYERFEEFVVVPPEGVVGIISVKKRLRLTDLRLELDNLERAYNLCHSSVRERTPYLGVFAFTSDQTSHETLGRKIFEGIKRQSSGKPYGALVNEVSVLDRLVVFKFRAEHSPPGTAKYVRVDSIDKETGLVALNIPLQRMLQSILSVYYDPLRGAAVTRPGFVSFYKGTFNDAPILGAVPVAAGQDR